MKYQRSDEISLSFPWVDKGASLKRYKDFIKVGYDEHRCRV